MAGQKRLFGPSPQVEGGNQRHEAGAQHAAQQGERAAGPEQQGRAVERVTDEPEGTRGHELCVGPDLRGCHQVSTHGSTAPDRQQTGDPKDQDSGDAEPVGERLRNAAQRPDVVAALEGRSYGIGGNGGGRLTFDLFDDYCPWNAGRWRLEVSEGRARVARVQGDADIALDANDLAAIFLGGFTATGLAAAGRVTELRPGALAVADGLFPTATKPWCPQEF